jgi:hypothetical protein
MTRPRLFLSIPVLLLSLLPSSSPAQVQSEATNFIMTKERFFGDVTNSRGVIRGVTYVFKDYDKGQGRVFVTAPYDDADSGTWRVEKSSLCLNLRNFMTKEACFPASYAEGKLRIGAWFREE